MKNLVLITSVINPPNTPLSYTKIRSVFTRKERHKANLAVLHEREYAALEEVVMAIKTRSEFFNLKTNIKTNRLYPTARLVAGITGMNIPRNKAIVGENAFSHEAGIHQHGMLQHSSTYEIMRPDDVGISHSNLVLGKHSGRHAFRERVTDLGFDID